MTHTDENAQNLSSSKFTRGTRIEFEINLARAVAFTGSSELAEASDFIFAQSAFLNVRPVCLHSGSDGCQHTVGTVHGNRTVEPYRLCTTE